MSERLPETLKVDAGTDQHSYLMDEAGNDIARLDREAVAIAHRIAACYRACAGIPTDRLEWACQGASDSHRLARLESELHRAALAGLDRSLEAVGVANTPGRQIP
jgi:hypothetical protein